MAWKFFMECLEHDLQHTELSDELTVDDASGSASAIFSKHSRGFRDLNSSG